MAFGISCTLPSRRKMVIDREPEDEPKSVRAAPKPPLQRPTRRSPERYFPTLTTCGLSDPVFHGHAKWPRVDTNNGSMGFSKSHEDVLPAMTLPRPTRHGLSHSEGDVFTKSRLVEKELKAKLKQLQFPVLDLLQPTRIETRRQASTAPSHEVPARAQRHVALPRSFRSNLLIDATGRRIFSEAQIL